MKKGKIGSYIIQALVFGLVIVLFKWRDVSRMLIPTGLPPNLLLLALVLIVVAIIGRSLKRAILTGMVTDYEFIPVNEQDFPRLDRNLLYNWTSELQALGFVHVKDYTVRHHTVPVPPGFARLLVHPQHRCYAEIHRIFNLEGDRLGMNCSFASMLSDRWSVSTTTVKPCGAQYMLRRPKGIWTSRPGTPLSELLRIHLQKVQQVTEDLGLEVLYDVSEQAYFAEDQQSQEEKKEIVRRRQMGIMLLEVFTFPLRPVSEWNGAYSAAAKKRKHGYIK